MLHDTTVRIYNRGNFFKDFLMKHRFPIHAFVALLAGILWLGPGPAFGETISFPLQVDYPFLRTLVIQSAFTDPSQTMMVTDQDNDCQQIVLSNPRFENDNNLLRIEAAVHLEGGTFVGGNCLLPVEWDGYLVAHLKPRMSPTNWRLSFDAVDSVLLDKNRRPDSLVGHLWRLFEAPVMARMSRIRIALNEPIEQIKPFLLASMPESDHPRMTAMLASLRPGAVVSESDVLKIQVLADIETGAIASEPAPAPLTDAEIDAFVEMWETWDAFLVQAMMSLLDMPLSDEERGVLMGVLLDARYRFVQALSAKTPVSSGDFVREQFVDAWTQLAPVFKAHLAEKPSTNAWGYLAFFTASDALAALDKLGPSLNIEISRNGFIRLARMLSENKALTLQYDMLVNPALRTLLGMAEAPAITAPAFDEKRLEEEGLETLPETEAVPPLSLDLMRRQVLAGLCRTLEPASCWAATAGASPSVAELKYWLAAKGDAAAHLQKVRPVIETAARENLAKNPVPEAHVKMFQDAVFAFAWQESCFRQFIMEKGKLTYIRSYTNTSVGMMQINERVWRGMYNIEHLRWDIHYNAAAGIDILNTYFRKYALPKLGGLKGKEALDSDGLASSLYAMYNAGPGGFSKFVKRRAAGKATNIDKHFKEKYDWVKSGQWDRLNDCL